MISNCKCTRCGLVFDGRSRSEIRVEAPGLLIQPVAGKLYLCPMCLEKLISFLHGAPVISFLKRRQKIASGNEVIE